MNEKKLTQKLLVSVVMLAVVELSLVVYFAIKSISPIPLWGEMTLWGLGGLVILLLIIYVIRKLNQSEDWDNLL